ncbi:sugar transferase [Luteipulveratus mongoliensis]|nr:sugar transferase [Luteipulveratus mongoliensis]
MASALPDIAVDRETMPESEATTRANDWTRPYLIAVLIADLVAAIFSEIVGVVATDRVPLSDGVPTGYLWICALGPLLWIGTVAISHGYERRFLGVGTEEYRAIPRAAIRLVAATALISFGLYDERPYLSRIVVVTFFPLLIVSALALRYAVRRVLYHRRHQGLSLSRAVVVGESHATAALISDLHREPTHGLRAVAACEPHPKVTTVGGIDVELSGLDHVIEVIDEASADVVIVASPSELSAPDLRRLSWALEKRSVDLIVSPGIMEVAGPRLSIRPAANLSLMHVERPRLGGATALGKYAFDKTIASLMLFLALPVFVLVAIAIRLESKGPIFFIQNRVGIEGRTFRILKFRSMSQDAEQQKAHLLAVQDDGNGTLFKLREDPRVTRVGKFIRRYSIDELPQLLNVLRGDMSLIGPRPPLQSEVDGYERDVIRRLRVRPGLTGLWQVSGRSNLSWDESVRLDLRYVDNWSMMLDLHILWRTARAVVRGAGAY